MSTPKTNTPFIVGLACAALAPAALANPDGMTVVSGSGSAQTVGSQLNVNVGQVAVLDWSSFNIGAGETTRFFQPGADSIVFNRINDANPSQIWGNLIANGSVILANAHGLYFGPDSMVQVGGSFVATTAPIAPDLGAGGQWQFTGMPPAASIINYGSIEAGAGKNLFLIAANIENHGRLAAPHGDITLAAGQDVLLSERPDGRGVNTTVRIPAGAVNNFGRITADAGTIALQARVVNQNGRIEANSIREENGVVELIAGEEVNLGANSVIQANGDSTGPSTGGAVTIKSGGTFADADGSRIEARGGTGGGNGGDVEVSAATLGDVHSRVDGAAQAGFVGGRMLIDPTDLTLNNNSLAAYSGFSQITFLADNNITLAANTVWNLSSASGLTEGLLTLRAGKDIIFGNGARIFDANNWSVTLDAGYNFANNVIQSGVGNIYLNGGSGLAQSGAIETAHGNINLTAGDSIIVGTGYIRTTGGGGIAAHAVSGDVNAGRANGGYAYTINGYSVSQSGLGQIATAAGGDVRLEAGRDVISIPTVAANTAPGASGAYGSQTGDVTVIAGRSILGNYLVRNGTGTLLAGVQLVNGTPQILNPTATIGSLIQPVSLNLISGTWNAWAGGDVFINEVRNPNGTFNANRLLVDASAFPGNLDGDGNVVTPPNRSGFLFDYAADAAANFWAGNGITLVGANLPRVNGQNTAMPAIYAPRLSLNAGAGGINILSSLILAPSAQGALSIITRNGGNLNGQQLATSLTGITMSDSALPGWATFASGHAVSPLHLGDVNPVTLEIAGSIHDFGLIVPTFARVNVAGDTFNFGFRGQNLATSGEAARTEIHVAGDITYRGNLTSVTLAEAPPAALLDTSISPSPATILKLRYDATTGTLTFVGQMTAADLQFLLNPTVFVYDQFGQQVFDANEQPVTQAVAISAPVQTALNQLYADSQSASLGDQGLALAGPGQFNVTARSIDLGISGGINVLAPDRALENISPLGAQLTVNVAQNLEMTSTKIANESYLGGITLDVGGALNVGGQFSTFGDPGAPKGIFTTSGGGISVTAQGDVNVNGSRIASYNGGNITVRSEHGDVNAGSGGSGYVSLNALELDPVTGRLVSVPSSIPGSGILATTLPGAQYATLGNITVDALEGNIYASQGGIIQLALSGADARNNFVALNAGKDIVANNSGVIGSNVRLDAGGDIRGVIIGTGNVNISSQHNVEVTALGGGGVNVNAVGTVSGTVVGGSGVSVSGDAVTAAVVSQNTSVSGDSSGAEVGLPASNVSKTDTKTSEDASDAVARKEDEEDENKVKKAKAVLRRLVGRVTVLLSQK